MNVDAFDPDTPPPEASLPIPGLVSAAEVDGDLLLVAVFQEEAPPVAGLAAELAEVVSALAERPGFSGRKGQHAERDLPDGPVDRVALRGLGKRSETDRRRVQKACREALEAARHGGARQVDLLLPDELAAGTPGEQGSLLASLVLAGYRFDRFKATESGLTELSRVRLVRAETRPAEEAAEVERLAREIAAGTAFTRDLANTPPNVATPEWMASQAEALAARYEGLEAEVLVVEDLERLGMGGLLAVGGGSANSPRLVRLVWRGAASPRFALVGKGVTFDTGGISLKPGANMDEMKYDKAGACAVLGTLRTAAGLGLPVHLEGVLALAENMPDGRAYRPGDIVRCYNGKTVEVLNTDAEGRMILADALAWASEHEPDAIVELSTLTGACVVALGSGGAGLFTPDDRLAEGLLAAADGGGDRLWRLPLWPEFREALDGTHADLKNVAGRWGGACIAAAFLASFVGEGVPWAHLDIAGPSYVGSDGEKPRGATGYGVGLLTRWLLTGERPG